MMGISKFISLTLVLIYHLMGILLHGEFAVGNSSPSTNLSEREDMVAKLLHAVADNVELIKQNLASGKQKRNKESLWKPIDCADVLQSGHNMNGVYTIWPKYRIIYGSVEVYCDMDTDGGGWTVIQRRGDYGPPEDYFYRNWESYKRGFGDIKEDFWLGNDLIFSITSQRRYSIRFDLGDIEGNTAYALYDNFLIEDESEQYRLHISNYRGNASDSMIFSNDLNNMKFSTKDRDNDKNSFSCRQNYKGGWWYKACPYRNLNNVKLRSNLNGLYLKGETSNTGIIWYSWKTSYESLSTTEMKIRPMSFQKV